MATSPDGKMIIRVVINATPPQPPTQVTQRRDRHCLPKKKRGTRCGESVKRKTAAARNTSSSHNDANSGARPLRGNSLANDHQDPTTSPQRCGGDEGAPLTEGKDHVRKETIRTHRMVEGFGNITDLSKCTLWSRPARESTRKPT